MIADVVTVLDWIRKFKEVRDELIEKELNTDKLVERELIMDEQDVCVIWSEFWTLLYLVVVYGDTVQDYEESEDEDWFLIIQVQTRIKSYPNIK